MHKFEVTSIQGFVESKDHARGALHKIASRLSRKIGSYTIIDTEGCALLLRTTGIAAILPRFLAPILFWCRALGYTKAVAIHYSFFEGMEGKHVLMTLWGNWPKEIRAIAIDGVMSYANAYGVDKLMFRQQPFYLFGEKTDWTVS